MSEQAAIEIRGLTKIYNVYPTPLDIVRELTFGRKRHSEYTALNSIDLTVNRGEVVGVIGPNGAGKSTLLRIIAGTLDHTAGQMKINGTLAAILELGTGFQPEYSGRENVIIGGMCLGMSKTEVEEKLQSIIDFSELGDVIDQPFKTYSSGMKARLTFSTAISVEPDVFIIDEALAAGDAYFVQKCLRKIREICMSGATVLFVSHSENLVAELCDRAIWLDGGRILSDGPAEPVAKAYIQSVWAREESVLAERNATISRELTIDSGRYSLGGTDARIIRVTSTDSTGKSASFFTAGSPWTLRVEWAGDLDPSVPHYISFRVDGGRIQAITGVEGHEEKFFLSDESIRKIEYSIPHLDLGEGRYSVSVSLCRFDLPKSPESVVHYEEQILFFDVGRRVLGHLGYVYEPCFTFTEVV
jgi:lipopolysaccharide transport system ATP-binding protein